MLSKQQYRLYTCVGGIIASALVGFAEAKLHYSSLGFGGEPYLFFTAISDANIKTGHFIAAFSACFYLIGFSHIYTMMKDQSSLIEKTLTPAFFYYGMSVGSVWLGSRLYLAKIAKLAYSTNEKVYKDLLNQFSFFNESLLWGTRISILIGSLFLVYLILKSKTDFPKYLAFFNPICTVVYCFLIFLWLPQIGQYLMPIAMNVAFFLFFSLSFFHLIKKK